VIRVLMATPPIHGHAASVVGVARGLVERGFAVDVLTGAKYRGVVEAAGAGFLPLPPEADYDDADLDAFLPDRARRRGLAALRYDMIGMFARVIPAQDAAVAAALAGGDHAAVLADVAFGGVTPLLLRAPAAHRPPVLGLSSVPVTVTSIDTAPFGPGLTPRGGRLGRLRNRILNRLVNDVMLRDVDAALAAALRECGIADARVRFFDGAALFDEVFQLSAPGLEYPRRELAGRFRAVGPLRAPAAGPVAEPPAWWGDLDAATAVVHVTQGTIDNHDPTRLIVPTIRALAGADVLVVAATGGRDPREVRAHFPGGLPANARVASFLPYGDLLPHTDVVVTNGGFGGVQQALRHGIPLVVAGATEDKPEVAARVAWAGAGIDLRSGSPRPSTIAAAVDRVRRDPRYRRGAERIRAEIVDAPDPVEVIAARLERCARPARV